PPDTKGIVENATITSAVGRALGRATSTPDAPVPQRVAVLEWEIARADALLAEIQALYASEVPAYREALRAAGFELLGG
ncbi:MAG TPA: hypothetical protein VMK65_10945, partial [Longimicrobiales bacterium]|nr:hypothetical protein [Longimicrobiales bacterium]